MKVPFISFTNRRGLLVLAACGLLLLFAASWLVRDPYPQTAERQVRPLESAPDPQDPKSLYKGRESAVCASLVEALALEKDVPSARRTELLRSASGDLAGTEVDLLVASLLAERPTAEELGEHTTRFNEMANLLHRQPEAGERLARAMITVAEDSARDATLRDYALQHLRMVWNDSAGDAGLRDSITKSLRRLARADQTLATSALLSLHLLGDTASGPDQPVTRSLGDDETALLASHLLEGGPDSRLPAARMTAARIAADRRLAALRPALARIASDPAEHTLARISAIHAIGRIGDPADRTLLESLASAGPALVIAARDALKTLPNQ